MKTNKNFLKKLTAGILGFVMTLGVGAAGYAGAASESRAATDTTMSVTTTSGTTWTATDGAKATFTGTSKSASSYYHVQKVEDITSTSFKIDFSQTVSVTVGIGSYGGKGKSTAQCWLTSGGSVISNKATATPNDTKSVDYTMTLNPTSGNNTVKDVVFNFGITSASTTVYIRLYKISISYKSAPTKTLSSIAVKTAPTKTTYTAGENFDPTGLVITKTYTDATTDDLAYAGHTGDFTFSPSLTTALTTLNTSVTITVGGKTTTQNITVNEPTPVSFEVVYDANAGSDTVNNMPDPYEGTEEYTIPVDKVPTRNGYTFVEWNTDENGEGDSYDPGDVINEDTILYAIWEEKPKSDLDPGTYSFTLVPGDFTTYQSEATELTKTATEVGGTKTGTIKLKHKQIGNYSSKIQFHKSDGWLYNVTPLCKIDSITINGNENLTAGYDTDFDGDFEYRDPSTDNFPYFEITTSGTGKSSSIVITFTIIEEKTIDTVAIKTNPNKVVYDAGEKFDPSGLVVHVTYVEDGVDSEDIPYDSDTASSFTFTPDLETNLSKTVSQIQYTYKGTTPSDSISVTVNGIHRVTIEGENSVYIGESITLTASCIDGDNVIEWAYGDEDSSSKITLTGNGGSATVRGKQKGNATIKAKCTNGTWSEPYTITVSAKPAGFMLVSDASVLTAGNQLIIGATKDEESFAAGTIASGTKFLSSQTANITDSIISCSNAEIFTLEGDATSGWLLNSNNGYLCKNGADLKYAGEDDTPDLWSISITSDVATIAIKGSDPANRILYNSSSPRFKTYTSNTTISLFLPSIYCLQSNDSIKYDANGGFGDAIRDENIYEEGDPFTAKPLTFTRDYYTATGWNTAKDGSGTSYTPGQSYTFESNMTLYAQWQGDQYTITYKNMGGSAFDGTHGEDYPTKHTYGTTTQLDTPTKTGYTFGGWFDNSGCTGNPITSVGATDKTSDFTLYAKWTPISATIKYFNTDGSAYSGNFDPNKVSTYTYGTQTTLNPAKKAGFTFNGFYDNKECTGSKITSIGATEHTSSDDIVLYVSFTVHTWNITYYDKTSGDAKVAYSGNNKSSLPTTFNYDEGVTLVAGTKDHYTFGGWYTSNVSTSAITKIAGNTSANDHDYELYARWIADEYNISYKYKNASGEWTDYTSSGVAKTHTYGTATTLTAPTALSGYSFKGFYTDEALQNKITVIGAEQITDDITIYMDTEISEFTLHYNNVVADDMPVGMPTTHTYGTATTLPAAIDKADGTYEFKGWYFNENLTTRVPGDLGNQQIPATKTGTGGVLELYARWDGSDHNITYKDQGDKTFSGTHQDDYAKKYTYGTAVTLDSPTKTGYDFNGYYNDSACEGTRVTSIPENHAPEAITVYAKWTAQTYTITYSEAGTDYTLADGSPTSHTYDTVTELKAPSKAGFTFEGWFTSPSFSGDPISSIGKTAITTNITLYAKFVFGAQEGLDKLNKDIGMAYDKTLKDNGGGVETSWERYDGSQTIENGDKFVFVSRWTNSSNVTKYYAAKNEVDGTWYSSVEITDISSMSFADNLCWTVSDVVPKTETTDAKFNLSYVDSNNTTQYMSLGENNVNVVSSKPTNPLNYIAKKTVNQIDNYSVATTAQSGRVLMYRQDTGQKFRNYLASQIGNYTSEVMTFIKKGSSPRYENVDFRFNLKFAGLQTFAEKNNVDADYGIKLTMTENESVRERYFSLKNNTVTETGVDGSKTFAGLQGNADNGYLTLLLGDVLNEGSKDYHSPDIMFKIQLYVVDDKGNKYESETFVEYSVKSWVEYYHTISKYAAATQQLYDIFFPSENN